MENKTNYVPAQSGLLPITHDTSKDWSHFKHYGSIKKRLFGSLYNPLAFLPKTLGRTPVQISEQGLTNFCTAHAIAGAIGNQVKIPMSPEWQTAKEGQIAGSPILGGTDPKTALKTACEYGALPKQYSPYTQEENRVIMSDGTTVIAGGDAVIADWNKYDPALDQKAEPFKAKGYYNVLFGNPDDLDTFDMIKLALWDAKDDVENGGFTPVIAMGFWYGDYWNNVGADGLVPMQNGNGTNRHAYLYYDFDTINGVEYLLAQLSQGEDFGDKGVLKFTREEINLAWQNHILNGIGMYILRRKSVPFMNWVLNTLGGIIHTLKGIFNGMIKK